MKKVFFFFFITILIFLTTIFILSINLYNADKKIFNLQKEVIFYKTLQASKDFLFAIINEYQQQKTNIIKAHKFVLSNLDKNFSVLKKQLGENYEIFLTNKDFIITKTTFQYDKNFSLAFAKNYFLSHKGIGISKPICEMATTNFIAFSDSYQKGKVLQIGYIFNSPKIEEFKKKIFNLKKQNKMIKDIYLYFLYPNINFASKCNFLVPLHRKYTLKEMNENQIFAFKLFDELKKQNPIFKNNSMYILSSNPFGDGYMIFKIDMDFSVYQAKLDKIKNILIFTILFLLFIGIVLFLYFKKVINFIEEFAKQIQNEDKFEYKGEFEKIVNSYNQTIEKLHKLIDSKKEFLEFVMHELKTPLAILSLNVENEISISAIKKLNMAYDDMAYFLEFNKSNTKTKKVNLKKFIEDRIFYFDDIIKIEKKIVYAKLDECCIDINESDLERFVDNNISNAIKYSTTNFIKITLKDCVLRFENDGNIENKDKIFEKFYREDSIKGGFGIGLSIISSIILNYNITFNLITNNKVIFEYDLKGIVCK